MIKIHIIVAAYSLKNVFWTVIYRTFMAFQRAQSLLPTRLQFETAWEGRVQVWLGIRGSL